MEAGTGPGAGPLAAVPRGGGVTGNERELGGPFMLGPWRVRRTGYGAMQLAGDGVFGSPRDRDEALRVLLAVVNLRVMDPSETPGRRFDAQLAVLVQAREEGLIDGIGLSNVSRAQLLRAVAQTQVVCVQNLFNLADQRSLDVLTECQARNIAFVPFCPLGLPGEVRHRLLADPVLAALGVRLGATPVQVALAWLLDLAPNVLLIPGTRTRAHLADNLASADVKLDDDARAELARHFPASCEPEPGDRRASAVGRPSAAAVP
jgi:diketogulonate reductase-like aldo/keto reductase